MDNQKYQEYQASEKAAYDELEVTRPLQVSLNDLSSSIERLDYIITDLVRRLEPISTSMTKSIDEDTEKTSKQNGTSPTTSSIDNSREHIARLSQRLSIAIDGLEV